MQVQEQVQVQNIDRPRQGAVELRTEGGRLLEQGREREAQAVDGSDDARGALMRIDNRLSALPVDPLLQFGQLRGSGAGTVDIDVET